MSDPLGSVYVMHPHFAFKTPEDPGSQPPLDLATLLKRPPAKPRRIRCPWCAWVPRAADRWWCGPKCGHSWNTFDTQGRCPKCDYQWEETVCLSCHRWSRHRDWYVDEGGAA